ncbi:ABC transporter substrate-binding protein [Arcanobacterium phocisimile]|uniref:ABC transporter substrate-binding protein n=1 Tax=Arcanobacterium phocisimile TaxID=1302235 RepID=A0ABX7IIJ7_9ACTO|nr:ABC transporter substrate-binding protein [Arcanobacterium phocisimile]QRV02953.1 ABC transporter substrate-binding protein [Arcanobacterium phocisimile]
MKKIIVLCTALLTALLLTGCGQTTKTDSAQETPEDTPQREKITLGLTYIPDVQFGPLYVALEKGYFDEAGLDVTLRHHGAQEALFGALESGAEDIVFAGATEMMQARSQGLDVVNWATLYQKYPVTLITPTSAGVTSPADLIGKKIGLPGPYGENYYALLAMEDSYELKDKITPSYIGYTQTAALMGNEVDAIIGFENNDLIALEQAGLDVEQINMVKGTMPLVGVGLGSLKSNLNPKVYAKVLGAIEKGVKDSQSDPQAAMDIIAEHVPSLADPQQRALAEKVFDATLKLYAGSEEFGYQDPQLWEKMSIFLANTGIVDKAVPPLSAFTAEVVKLNEAAKAQ